MQNRDQKLRWVVKLENPRDKQSHEYSKIKQSTTLDPFNEWNVNSPIPKSTVTYDEGR